jgi:protein-S-isoprenylcysteine O-methyltransferase Ste14
MGKMGDYKKRDIWFQIPGLILLIAIMVASTWDYRDSLYVVRSPTNLVAAILFGVLLVFRIWSHVVLDRSYSATIEIRDDHRLVKTGPYKYIRHPIYTGTILSAMCIPVFTSSLAGFLLSLLSIPLFIYRINIEEKMLIEEYGDEYREYQKDTWRLFPYLY